MSRNHIFGTALLILNWYKEEFDENIPLFQQKTQYSTLLS